MRARACNRARVIDGRSLGGGKRLDGSSVGVGGKRQSIETSGDTRSIEMKFRGVELNRCCFGLRHELRRVRQTI
jgi:hypothetical protein